MTDRRKNMCFHIEPIYCGDRPANTRGNPNESKDYYFRCYVSAEKNQDYRQSNKIEGLCNGCKKYHYVRPLIKEEIKERFYNGKTREVQVVSSNSWHFETR